MPVVPEERVKVAGRGPVAEGLNWMPSQQLVQGPVVSVVNAADGGWP